MTSLPHVHASSSRPRLTASLGAIAAGAAAAVASFLLFAGPEPDAAASAQAFAEGARSARDAVGASSFAAAKLGVTP